MEPGTWGEWAGAIGTTAAAVVALYLGLRDPALAADRSAARATVRIRAASKYRALGWLEQGLDETLARDHDVADLQDGDEATDLTEAAARLRWARRAWTLALIRSIYGKHAVQAALIAPRGDISAGGTEMNAATRLRLQVIAILAGELHPVTGTRYHQALVKPIDMRRVARLRRRFWLLARF